MTLSPLNIAEILATLEMCGVPPCQVRVRWDGAVIFISGDPEQVQMAREMLVHYLRSVK